MQIDRVNFLESVSGISYPEMIVDFFDHFIALKEIVEDSGSINVIDSKQDSIRFSIKFSNPYNMSLAINTINSRGGVIVIYGRPISISVEVLTDSELIINLR